MFRRRGRILAIKPGLNPNSSSLGVDVTFLLVGAAALAMFTPVVAAMLRLRKPLTESDVVINDAPVQAPTPPIDDDSDDPR